MSRSPQMETSCSAPGKIAPCISGAFSPRIKSAPLRAFVHDYVVDVHAEVDIVKTHPSTRYAALASNESIVLWDILHSRPARIFDIGRVVTAMSFSADGTKLAAGTDDGSLEMWDVGQGARILLPQSAHTGPVATLGHSHPTARGASTLFSGGQDGKIFFWPAPESSSDAVLLGNDVESSSLAVINGLFTPSNRLSVACVQRE